MRRAALLAVALVMVVTAPAVASSHPKCTDHTGPVPYATGSHHGYVAYPSKAPKGIVVFFHGIGHTAEDWAGAHLEDEAQASRVITVAMDYGEHDVDGSWQVLAGAEASVAAAQALQAACPMATTTVAYGVSMGGNSSGLALAEHAGVFDWWFAIEGAHNMLETYLEATAVAVSGNETATAAKAGIETEAGGTPAEVPDHYARRVNVLRAPDIAASGIRGVVMVHAVDDGLVPYNQSREMAAALRGLGIPVEFTTATTTDGGEPGTTADSYVPVEHEQPFAGHANEDSTTHVVGRLGFERLRALFADRPTVADGDAVH